MKKAKKESAGKSGRFFKNILELEKSNDYEYSDYEDFGWQFNEVPGLSGGMLSKFLSEGLVRRAFTSQSTKTFRGNVEKIRKRLGAGK